MLKVLSLSLDKKLLKMIRLIGREAQDRHLRAFVVGGFVRDILLKRKNLDLDIVVEGDAIEFSGTFARKSKGALKVYRKFGTATLIFKNNLQVDFSTARKETYSSPGALPVVAQGSIHDDLCRRDFTVNAMAVAITPQHFGQLVDDFNGLQDLKKKEIRVLHNLSFSDDPTRILRAVRFEQRLRFKIEPKTLKALKEALAGGFVDYVKPPRYFEEFQKLLKEPVADKCLRRLQIMGGLDFLNPALKSDSRLSLSLAGAERNIRWFEDAFPTEKPLARWLVAMMVLVHDSDAASADRKLSSFQLKREDKEKILSGRDFKKITNNLSASPMKPSAVYKNLKPFSIEALIFFRMLNKNGIIGTRIDSFLRRYRFAALSLDGRDVLHMGAVQSKKVGMILKKVLYAKIDGDVKTHKDEEKLAQRWIDISGE